MSNPIARFATLFGINIAMAVLVIVTNRGNPDIPIRAISQSVALLAILAIVVGGVWVLISTHFDSLMSILLTAVATAVVTIVALFGRDWMATLVSGATSGGFAWWIVIVTGVSGFETWLTMSRSAPS